MNRFMLLFMLIGINQALRAQTHPLIYTIKADSVKITNSCDTAELIIENHTQNVPGFLYNKGRGRTEFRKGMITLNDSLYLIGGDTLNLNKGRTNIIASNALNAIDGHVKMGGDITDYTLMKFDLVATGGLGVWSIYSFDESDWFQVWNQDDGEFLIAGAITSADGNTELILDKSGFTVKTERTTGAGLLQSGFRSDENGMVLRGGNFLADGKLSVGNDVVGFTPTAQIHIAAGSASAGTAPIKLTAGALLTTPENGTIEFDGTDLYLTQSTTRYKLSKTLTGQLTTSFGGPSLGAYNSVTTTLSVAGAQPGDVVTVSANTNTANPPSIMISAYVTSANTVTLQAYNASNSAVTVAADTYKVRVIQ